MVKGTIRSAFEYGGQKCSACSRMYVPDSIWPQVKRQLLDIHKDIRVGDVSPQTCCRVATAVALVASTALLLLLGPVSLTCCS